MKLNFKKRLFLYFTFVFSISIIGVTIFERNKEREQKIETLEGKLDVYTSTISSVLSKNVTINISNLDSLVTLFPPELRVSLIDKKGKVVFDNSIKNLNQLENHSQRPEILALKTNSKGTDIRNSASKHQPYLYYAKDNGIYFIRVALPYNINTKNFLKPDNSFVYFILVIYLSVLFLINSIIRKFGKSVTQLRDLAINTKVVDSNFHFSDNELDEIGKKLTENYLLLEKSKNEINIEKEKLLQHIHNSKEGICFFNPQMEVEFYNGHFIQYLHLITDSDEGNPNVIFTDKAFERLQLFLKDLSANFLDYKISKQGKIFNLRLVFFENKGFEIILNDITLQEKNRILKQEMTGNIAHELRTPVTGIRGYLETVLSQPLDEKKQLYFIEKAFNQTKALSELIQDMSLISKIEEASHTFPMQSILLKKFIENIREEYSIQLAQKEMQFTINISENCEIKGNPNLLNSIFKNLIDNALRYAGNNMSIVVNLYNQDADFCYFSFYDTGKGIEDEKHLSRLFERFYRVNEGRSRDLGGSGLGLSIVKNAIQIHGGTIYAKNRKGGGLEFLFHLKRV
ncbi:MAG: hypothetical protein LC105_06710 [Chitinophagales bacterium]|nr:ATP-binding protein [Chitinophagales bacterium]MCZ2393527.1 hypothetical protein [Chitinophagales bacterium]